MYPKILKRTFDIIFSFIFLIVFSPLMLIISLFIVFESKGQAIFTQNRVGKNKNLFKILKFRTMREDTPSETPTNLLSNSEKYITKVGRILRKTSLDEIPQLINILRGDMSFIGPRPALWNQFDLISERDKYNANSIRPGLTGWAQINGRDELPIQKKAMLDGEYINNIKLLFDVRCILMTFAVVISQRGIKEGSENILK